MGARQEEARAEEHAHPPQSQPVLPVSAISPGANAGARRVKAKGVSQLRRRCHAQLCDVRERSRPTTCSAVCACIQVGG